jgi:molybdopterin biosynthesis enzyme
MSVEADFTHSTGPLRAELVACTLDDTGRAHRLPAQGSGNLSGRARAEGVALIPPATTTHPRDRIDWYSYTDLIA